MNLEQIATENHVIALSERIAEVQQRRELNNSTRMLYANAGAQDFERFLRVDLICTARIAVLTEGLRMALTHVNAAA